MSKFVNTPDSQIVRYLPLGGVADANKNMHVYEMGGDIIAVDCGYGFPDETMPGVDYRIPDVTYLKENINRVKGIIITHGHEDHYGALPMILPEINVPVYATPLVTGLIKVKLFYSNLLEKTRLETINPNETLRLGAFELEFFRINHSVPDSVGICIKTPQGNIIHAADYKFDWTPVDGQTTEVDKLARYGHEGVLCLLSDCLRVERPGYTLSEKMVQESFEREIRKAPGRVIITTFASNISRVQQAVNASAMFNRKITFASRSMERNFFMAEEIGYAKMPPKMFAQIKRSGHIPHKNLTVMASGSQGEPQAALTQIAHGNHRFIQITPGDTVIFSSDPIPGNEEAVRRTIDLLTSQGARVIYSDIHDDIHVSGHGSREELKLMIGLTKPKNLIPIGGTRVMEALYKEMAVEMGIKENSIFTLEPGQTVEFSQGVARLGKKLSLKNVMVDGLGIGDVGRVVLRDRETLAKEGIVIVVVPIDPIEGKLDGKAELISRGFIFEKNKEIGSILDDCRKKVEETVQKQNGKINLKDTAFLRDLIEENLEEFIFNTIGRTPMIIPIIIEA